MEMALLALTLGPSCTPCLKHQVGALSRLSRKGQAETGPPQNSTQKQNVTSDFPCSESVTSSSSEFLISVGWQCHLKGRSRAGM